MTGLKPTREQAMALVALVVLLTACAALVGWSALAWSEAQDELSAKRAVLTRLVRQAGGAGVGGPARTQRAPAAAFVDAPTQGQGGAQIEAHLTRLALAQKAVVMSSGIEPERKGEPDAIRLQASLETTLDAMQALLHGLESGTPYLVVESLTVQPAGASAQRKAENPPLRVNLVLRGLWRRRAA